ncbi:MAG: N-succinylarginine dihydrolase, partial [Pontixanthobacter sp.]
ATVDPRFMLNDRTVETIGNVVADHWPQSIEPGQIGDAALAETVMQARSTLLQALDLEELMLTQG